MGEEVELFKNHTLAKDAQTCGYEYKKMYHHVHISKSMTNVTTTECQINQLLAITDAPVRIMVHG